MRRWFYRKIYFNYYKCVVFLFNKGKILLLYITVCSESVNLSVSSFCILILFQYKLNCEVLRDDLGYEVRWIMDGEDIVMQLVSKLGKIHCSLFCLFYFILTSVVKFVYASSILIFYRTQIIKRQINTLEWDPKVRYAIGNKWAYILFYELVCYLK